MKRINLKNVILLSTLLCLVIAAIIVWKLTGGFSESDERFDLNAEIAKLRDNLQDEPDNSDLLLRLGDFLFIKKLSTRDFSEVHDCYMKAVQNAPNDKLKSFYLMRLCRIYGMTGETNNYYETLDQAIATKKIPAKVVGLNLLKYFYRERGDDLKLVINRFEDELDSGTIDLYGCCTLVSAYGGVIMPQQFEENRESKEITTETMEAIAEYSKKKSKALEKLCELKPSFSWAGLLVAH